MAIAIDMSPPPARMMLSVNGQPFPDWEQPESAEDAAEARRQQRAERWLELAEKRQRWRLRWHSLTCVCDACLQADFTVAWVEWEDGGPEVVIGGLR